MNQPGIIGSLFGISSESRLQDYLTSQREASEHLILNCAAPAMEYLLNHNILENNSWTAAEEQLYSKWIESTVQVNNFENSDADTTIHHLEYLFINQLQQLSISNCKSHLPQIPSLTGIDIFLNATELSLRSRIDTVQYYNVVQIEFLER